MICVSAPAGVALTGSDNDEAVNVPDFRRRNTRP